MHKRYYAQRMHIVSTIDSLLYQLHVMSFFYSPAIWTLIFRIVLQSQLAQTRNIDPTRSLRFYFILVLLVNIFPTWSHATDGAAQGRTIILDFIATYVPSRLRLVILDTSIIFLQMLLATIAFEIHVIENSEVQDTLLPSPSLPLSSNDNSKPPPFIIDLTFSHILNRLRESNAPIISPPSSRESILPLPNTNNPWSLPMALIRARAQRRDAAAASTRAVPGGLDPTP